MYNVLCIGDGGAFEKRQHHYYQYDVSGCLVGFSNIICHFVCVKSVLDFLNTNQQFSP